MPKKAQNPKAKKPQITEEVKPVILEETEEENPKKEIDPDLVESLFEEPVEPDEEDEDEDDIFAAAEEEEGTTW